MSQRDIKKYPYLKITISQQIICSPKSLLLYICTILLVVGEDEWPLPKQSSLLYL